MQVQVPVRGFEGLDPLQELPRLPVGGYRAAEVAAGEQEDQLADPVAALAGGKGIVRQDVGVLPLGEGETRAVKRGEA